MKEFSFKIEEELTKGLSPYPYTKKNSFFLKELINLQSSQEGLVPYEPVVLPLSETIISSYGLQDEVFPFPQLFIGKKNTFLLCSNRIFFVAKDWSHLYQLITYDADNVDTEKVIPTGGSWECVDFWDTLLFLNGVCTIIICNKDVMFTDDLKVYISDRTPISCGTAHKGRALLGGFNPASFWGSTWTTFINTWKEKEFATGISYDELIEGTSQLAALKENWVWWSSIGGGDLLMLFFPNIVGNNGFTDTAYSSTTPFIFDLLMKNEQGSAPMFHQGKVQAIRPLGDWVLVYSEEGVQAMRPVSSPTPTFQQIDLQVGGIAGRGAVSGNDKAHLYVDRSGYLTLITEKLEVNPLGYRSQFYPLLNTDIIVSHSAEPFALSPIGRFFISNGDKTYVYTSKGLSETTQWVTSAGYLQGTTVGISKQILSPTEIMSFFCTDEIDFGQAGLKTLEWVRLGGNETVWVAEDGVQLEVALEYKYKISNDLNWAITSYKKVNSEGVVFFPISALVFRVKVRIGNYLKLGINYVELGYKTTDRRFTRGVQVTSLG
jgi:hypothetical protein